MQETSSRPVSWRSLLIFLPAVLVLTADQLTKVWIRSHLLIGETLFEAGIFNITRVPPNTGAAFGIFQGGTPVLIIISFIFIILFLLYAFVFYRHFPSLDTNRNNLVLGLILGGTVGNLADRLNTSLGGVTDFIGIGSCKTAFFVPKKFAFHQFMRYSSAVDCNKGTVGPYAFFVNKTSNQFLT